MISSMTGFGRAEVKENGYAVSVETRSLNHRFLDVEIRLPKHIQSLEPELRELINSQVSRGRVSVAITLKGEQTSAAHLTIDKSLATTYMRLLEELKRELNLNGGIELQQVLSFPDIISFENSDKPDETVMEAVKKSVILALSDMKEMRLREGVEIRKDLELRITGINKLIKNIENYSRLNAGQLFLKLKERVAGLADVDGVNEGRLETEVALLAERADVTEECIRFKSHNTLFLELLNKRASEGRKLNFLLQEMHREANTIGAKANDAEIAHSVVEIKEEVEKLREQIQNIE